MINSTVSFKLKNKISIPKPQVRGLGDIVARVAEPIKQVIINHGPKLVADKLRNCNCDKRKQWLNRQFPL